MDKTRKCTKCLETKTLDKFPKSKRTVLGVGSWCRQCKGKLDSTYLKSNPEKYAKIKRKYYENNKEKALTRSKLWDKEHKKEARERHRRYDKKYPDKANLRAQNRRKRVVDAPGRGVTPQDWEMILNFYGNKCLKCGSREKITLDHVIPLSLGGWHDPSNIQPLCLSCNSGKQNRSCADYRPWNVEARAWALSLTPIKKKWSSVSFLTLGNK